MKKTLLAAVICSLLIFSFNLQAQDYYVSFAASGASTTVESVIVENITQNTSITLNGSDVLHLVSVITGTENTIQDRRNEIRFFPNPMNGYSTMHFRIPAGGQTIISVSDLAGKRLLQKQYYLEEGDHSCRLEGLNKGLYLVNIQNGKYSMTGRLISISPVNNGYGLHFEDTPAKYISTGNRDEKDAEGSTGNKGGSTMQYNINDRIIFTATGGDCIGMVSDIITGDKTIAFDFYPCIDGDGNKYPVVKIGNQFWMAKNLKTKKYNTGESIPLVTDNNEWAAKRYEAAYCFYNNDEQTYKNIFGAFYNHWAVSTGNLCPAGWHVPSWTEYMTMENYLIANRYNYDNSNSGNYIGKSLASTMIYFLAPPPSIASIEWTFSDDDGTVGNPDFPIKRNASGFSAIPTGNRIGGDGTFNVINSHAFWWTSTDYEQSQMTMARYRQLQYNWESFLGGYTYKWSGFSVRCIKNIK